jgi:adenine-specific DNA-methyltransferase
MELEAPVLAEAEPAEVFREDAVRFVRRWTADLAYLDPPYNQHQYGSNYHILNTLVRWDRQPVPLETGPDGRLLRKAGIPPAWKETRSPFCGRSTAREALASLVDALDVRALVLSYNTEGLVPPEELYGMLSERWEVRPEVLDYVRYRGGRQSGTRRVRNHELVYVCRARNGSRLSVSGLARLRVELRLRRLFSSRFDPRKILDTFESDPGGPGIASPLGILRMWRFHRFEDPLPSLEAVRIEDLADLAERLEACEVTDHARTVEVLAAVARDCADCEVPGSRPLSDARRAASEALGSLRKLAHPRYVREYERAEGILTGLAGDLPALGERLLPGLERLRLQRAERLRNR